MERLPQGTWVGRWAVTLARAAAQAVAAGESAILVAPDYRDQAQLAAALAAFLPPESIVQLDARQPNPERYRGLLRALGEAPVAILGNRSAVYAPAARLGLIAIWNDGDPLLAEPLSPNVHPRDAALVRQEQQDCALLIAGHTRTTEVQRLVEVGWLEELRPERTSRPHVIPTAAIAAQDRLAAQARIPSVAWREATKAVATGPVLVQVSRPGYTPGPPLRRLRGSRPLPALRRTAPVRAGRRSGVLRVVRGRRDRLASARTAGARPCAPRARAPIAPRTSSGAPSPACGSSSRTGSTRCSRSTIGRRS